MTVLSEGQEKMLTRLSQMKRTWLQHMLGRLLGPWFTTRKDGASKSQSSTSLCMSFKVTIATYRTTVEGQVCVWGGLNLHFHNGAKRQCPKLMEQEAAE